MGEHAPITPADVESALFDLNETQLEFVARVYWTRSDEFKDALDRYLQEHEHHATRVGMPIAVYEAARAVEGGESRGRLPQEEE